jgi:predicted PurR-regulated permease PerM
VITLLALAAAAGFVAAAAPPLAQQAAELVSQAPKYLQQLNDHSTVLGRLNNQFHLVDKLKAQASGGASLAAGGVLHAATVLISATFETVIVLVLVMYFLADLAQIKHGFYRLFPRHRRPASACSATRRRARRRRRHPAHFCPAGNPAHPSLLNH